jgi:hypothetical protein
LGKFSHDICERNITKISSRLSGTEPAGEYTVLFGKGNEDYEFGAAFFIHKKIISAGKRVEFASDRVPYIILRGRWCGIIVLNGHAPTEGKIDNVDRFYEVLAHVFYKFPKYHMKILFADLVSK